MRLVGAIASGWLADRVGRKTPLMISIAWYSVCNFIAGFSPTFWFLLLFRALLGIGMGAEWRGGSALVMENWPVRSRGFMSGILQGSGDLGFLLSSIVYGLFYYFLGWRGLLMIGVLPALWIVYVRRFVQEPPVWVENRRLQRALAARGQACRCSRSSSGACSTTRMTACWWMASAFVVGYSIGGSVPDLSAKGSASQPRTGRVAGHAAKHSVLLVGVGSGAGWRTASAAAGRSSSPPY